MRQYFVIVFSIIFLGIGTASFGAEFKVINIRQGLDLGNPHEPPSQKDYYINMGSAHGVQKKSALQVIRQTPSFNALEAEFQRNLYIPIAILEVIHVEEYLSVARLKEFSSFDQIPHVSPRAVILGDLIKLRATKIKEPSQNQTLPNNKNVENASPSIIPPMGLLKTSTNYLFFKDQSLAKNLLKYSQLGLQ